MLFVVLMFCCISCQYFMQNKGNCVIEAGEDGLLWQIFCSAYRVSTVIYSFIHADLHGSLAYFVPIHIQVE